MSTEAVVQPETICPFTVEVFPSTFFLDDVVFIKVEYKNTLAKRAYELYDPTAYAIGSTGYVHVEFEDESGCFSHVSYTEINFMPHPWNPVEPGASGAVVYYPFENALPLRAKFDASVMQRLKDGKKVVGKIWVSIVNGNQDDPKFRMATSEPITIVPQTSDNEFLLRYPELKGERKPYEAVDVLHREFTKYVESHPNDGDRVRAQFVVALLKFYARDEKAVSVAKSELDKITTESIREGIRISFNYILKSGERVDVATKGRDDKRLTTRTDVGATRTNKTNKRK